MTFIKQQQEIDPWDKFIEGLEPFNVSTSVMNRLCTHFRETREEDKKQIITNTVNHLLAGVEDVETLGYPATGDEIDAFNQANAKIRQRCADIISEVSE